MGRGEAFAGTPTTPLVAVKCLQSPQQLNHRPWGGWLAVKTRVCRWSRLIAGALQGSVSLWTSQPTTSGPAPPLASISHLASDIQLEIVHQATDRVKQPGCLGTMEGPGLSSIIS